MNKLNHANLLLDSQPLLSEFLNQEKNKHNKRERNCCKKNAIFFVILALALIGIALGLYFGFRVRNVQGTGAVVSNGEGCADIGKSILEDGGSAIDAAITVLLCEGVLLPHSLGIGGGFVATIFIKETGRIETLIARETAPAAAHQNMFKNIEITGALSAAIPSEIYGYWRLHNKYGKLPWKRLFEPTIKLCKEGHSVSEKLASVLEQNAERIRKEPTMAEIFINKETNEVYKEGEIIYRKTLGETLRIIADEGAQVLYRGGRIGKLLVEDIQKMGGIITESDLQNYEVRWEEPVVAHFTGGYTLYTTPLPTSGAILAFILNVMEPLYTARHDIYWQRVIETFKHAYGHRTNLGDIHFEPQVREIYNQLISNDFAAEIRNLIYDDHTTENMTYYGANFANEEDHGTANMAVLAPNGDAITVTSTINSHFGAKVRSSRTGIILNDEMDDFSTPGVVNAYGIPASPANFIKPGKRPMSSTCPSIVVDKDANVKLLIGGAGGSKITTSVAQTILRYFVFNETMADAVNNGRVHHQLAPMHVDVEPHVPVHTNNYLKQVGHQLNYLEFGKAYSALTSIGMKTNEPQPVCDIRRMGSIAVVYPKS